MQTSKIILFLSLFFLLLIAVDVSAVGLGSLKFHESFEAFPGDHFEKRYRLYPNSDTRQDYELRVSGDLKDYIVLEPPRLVSVSRGDRPTFKVIIDIPPDLKGGKYTSTIEVGETSARGGGSISILTAVTDTITAKVFFFGRAMKTQFYPLLTNEYEPLKFNFAYENWGTEPIKNALTVMSVYDIAGNLLFDGEVYATGFIPAARTVEHQIQIPINLTSGIYYVKAKTTAEGVNDSFYETNYTIGEERVVVLNVTDDLIRGTINKLMLDVESQWNSPLDNVYAEVVIPGLQKDFTSKLYSFKPQQRQPMVVFADIGVVNTGDYPGEVILYFNDKETHYDVVFHVSDKAIEEVPGSVKDSSSSSSSSSSSFSIVTIILIIIVILILVGLFVVGFMIWRLKDEGLN